MDLGLDGSALIVRDIRLQDEARYEAKEVVRLEGQKLRRALHLLRRMLEIVEIAERRGVLFKDLLAHRAGDPTGKGRLPTHRITWRGGEGFAWSESDALALVDRNKLRLADRSDEAATNGDAADLASRAAVRELHENRELEKLFTELTDLGLPVTPETFAGVQGEAVTGERLPARFAWITTNRAPEVSADDAVAASDDGESQDAPAKADAATSAPLKRSDQPVEAANLPSILDGLREIGRRGLEVKRFKGLGEMDAEQLWETTMDPAKRTLMKVTWDVASNADALFSILMGEEVEPRRRFIEEHALEVKNLDV
jgi:DNA gyrase subunit B